MVADRLRSSAGSDRTDRVLFRQRQSSPLLLVVSCAGIFEPPAPGVSPLSFFVHTNRTLAPLQFGLAFVHFRAECETRFHSPLYISVKQTSSACGELAQPVRLGLFRAVRMCFTVSFLGCGFGRGLSD